MQREFHVEHLGGVPCEHRGTFQGGRLGSDDGQRACVVPQVVHVLRDVLGERGFVEAAVGESGQKRVGEDLVEDGLDVVPQSPRPGVGVRCADRRLNGHGSMMCDGSGRRSGGPWL